MDGLTFPAIISDNDWLDLHDGEQGLLRGRLSTELKPGDTSMIVVNNSWEMYVVDIPSGYSDSKKAAGTAVAVLVLRNEDGIETQSQDIQFREEEE